ncbi:MAG: DMT family transporter [Eubacterium sp.]|nr:DMT family transporter [Eubacterium sp.]
MDSKIVKENKYRPYLAAFCAIGWSLAYPLIKYGYGEFNIADDLGSKLLFGGIRFAAAGLLVLVFGIITKINLKIKDAKNWGLIWLFALVNTSLHYMFAYIGLSNLPSSRSTILDSMGGFFLIILSGIIYKEDRINTKKLLGCLFGFFGIVLINIAPASEFFAQISFKGDGFILINACFAALGGILTRVVSRQTNMTAATGFGMFFGGLIMVACAFAFGIKTSWNITVKGIIILIILILI